MARLAGSKRKAPPPQIDVRVPRDGDDDDDDNGRGGRKSSARTATIPLTPSTSTTVRPSTSSFPVEKTTSVPVATSRTTPAEPTSALATITVTRPAQTTTVTMFVTADASLVTVTVTATPVSAISAAETSAPAPSQGVDTEMLRMDTTGTSAASVVMMTNSAQMSSAMVSGAGAAFIAGVGLAGMASFRTLLVVGKKDVADLLSKLDCQF
ncbi:hypothetical protein VTI74DRAFT_1487 [Chaetomium olivicolor]